MTSRVRDAVLPLAPAAVTVIDQLPVVSWSGVVNAPSTSTATSTGAGFGGGLAPAPTGAPSGGSTYSAATVTLVALVVRPCTGIAPFSNVVPSAGCSMTSVGTWMSGAGTVITICWVCSARLPVSGSVASILNWFLPRRSSTSSDHAPVESADVWRGLPATSTVTVPPGIVVPRRRYAVVSSSTSRVATDGWVTASVGGFAKRSTWTVR